MFATDLQLYTKFNVGTLARTTTGRAVIGLMPECGRSGIVPSPVSFFCSAGRADEWETFVTSHADMIPGYERDLAQATESIRLCAALKEAQGADLLAALEGYQ